MLNYNSEEAILPLLEGLYTNPNNHLLQEELSNIEGNPEYPKWISNLFTKSKKLSATFRIFTGLCLKGFITKSEKDSIEKNTITYIIEEIFTNILQEEQRLVATGVNILSGIINKYGDYYNLTLPTLHHILHIIKGGGAISGAIQCLAYIIEDLYDVVAHILSDEEVVRDLSIYEKVMGECSQAILYFTLTNLQSTQRNIPFNSLVLLRACLTSINYLLIERNSVLVTNLDKILQNEEIKNNTLKIISTLASFEHDFFQINFASIFQIIVKNMVNESIRIRRTATEIWSTDVDMIFVRIFNAENLSILIPILINNFEYKDDDLINLLPSYENSGLKYEIQNIHHSEGNNGSINEEKQELTDLLMSSEMNWTLRESSIFVYKLLLNFENIVPSITIKHINSLLDPLQLSWEKREIGMLCIGILSENRLFNELEGKGELIIEQLFKELQSNNPLIIATAVWTLSLFHEPLDDHEELSAILNQKLMPILYQKIVEFNILHTHESICNCLKVILEEYSSKINIQSILQNHFQLLDKLGEQSHKCHFEVLNSLISSYGEDLNINEVDYQLFDKLLQYLGIFGYTKKEFPNRIPGLNCLLECYTSLINKMSNSPEIQIRINSLLLFSNEILELIAFAPQKFIENKQQHELVLSLLDVLSAIATQKMFSLDLFLEKLDLYRANHPLYRLCMLLEIKDSQIKQYCITFWGDLIENYPTHTTPFLQRIVPFCIKEFLFMKNEYIRESEENRIALSNNCCWTIGRIFIIENLKPELSAYLGDIMDLIFEQYKQIEESDNISPFEVFGQTLSVTFGILFDIEDLGISLDKVTPIIQKWCYYMKKVPFTSETKIAIRGISKVVLIKPEVLNIGDECLKGYLRTQIDELQDNEQLLEPFRTLINLLSSY